MSKRIATFILACFCLTVGYARLARNDAAFVMAQDLSMALDREMCDDFQRAESPLDLTSGAFTA